MGTWGADSYQNDTACDWSHGLEDVDDLSFVSATIGTVATRDEEYLDSDESCEAIAACEVIARLKGNWGQRDAYTETVDNWVQAHPIQPPDDLVQQALQAIDRILTPPSELMELWGEGGVIEEWRAKMADLRARVSGT
jgi:hypothetical protein